MRTCSASDFDTSLLTANPLPNTFRVARAQPRQRARRRRVDRQGLPRVAKTDYAADTVHEAAQGGRRAGARRHRDDRAALDLSGDHHREHDPADGLCAPPRDRDHAAGRRDEHVHPHAVHRRRHAGRRARRRAWRSACSAIAEHQVVPKIAATLAFVPLPRQRAATRRRIAGGRRGGRAVASWFASGDTCAHDACRRDCARPADGPGRRRRRRACAGYARPTSNSAASTSSTRPTATAHRRCSTTRRPDVVVVDVAAAGERRLRRRSCAASARTRKARTSR